MKTLYITDLDGTLLQPNVEISQTSVQILKDLIQKGMLFTVATARSIASVKPILMDVPVSVPVILMNGVCIYDLLENKFVKIEAFEKESINALMSIIEANHLKGFIYAIKDSIMSVYYEDLSTPALQGFYQERVDRYQKKFTQVEHFSSLSEEPIIYFSLLDYKENLDPVYQQILKIPDLNCVLYKDNYSPDYWYLEIHSKSASKYHAVQFLRSYLGVDSVVCFGDNRNDFPLFEAGDYKIAVGNAIEELKEKADQVIGTNLEDGVAIWLKEHVRIL